MASMKSRVIAHINEIIAGYNDLPACEKQIARLNELGAPESLVASSVARMAAMREELPRMVAFIDSEVKASDSLTKIQLRCGAAGFTPEALYAIQPV